MYSNRKLFKSDQPIEDYLYSFSSRCASPVPKRKPSVPSADFSEVTKACSFISVNTSITRLSSMSGTHEPSHKSSEDLQCKFNTQVTKIHEDCQTVSDKASFVDEAKADPGGLDLDSGIPGLMWCAYCKGEIATEVFYVNSEKTFWASLAIFLSGGVFGCFLLPYSMNSCKHLQVRCHCCKHVIEQ